MTFLPSPLQDELGSNCGRSGSTLTRKGFNNSQCMWTTFKD